jgi:four helix bundle protein
MEVRYLQSFRNLKVWEKSHLLTLDVYRSTRSFPWEEIYGVTSQMRRSAASVGANIAEGSCRKGDAEFGRFLYIAMGSASELEYHLIFAHDLKMLKTEDYDRLSNEVLEVKRMLASFLQKLKANG